MDIIKVSPSSSFCIKDWGIEDEWIGNIEGPRNYKSSSTKPFYEIRNLPILNPKNGFLGKQLKALVMISAYYYPRTPLIQTIFSPLAQLKNTLRGNNLINAIRNSPESVKERLEIITESTIQFVGECAKLKIDGIFFSVQQASSDLLSKEEFIKFGKLFNDMIFPSINNFWIKLLHIHANNVYFDLVSDYPLNILNWHDRNTYPDLITASNLTKITFCGGLNRINALLRGTGDSIKREINDAIYQTGKKDFILDSGCVLPVISPYWNIKHSVVYARSI